VRFSGTNRLLGHVAYCSGSQPLRGVETVVPVSAVVVQQGRLVTHVVDLDLSGLSNRPTRWPDLQLPGDDELTSPPLGEPLTRQPQHLTTKLGHTPTIFLTNL